MRLLLTAFALASTALAVVSHLLSSCRVLADNHQPLGHTIESRQTSGACASTSGDAPYSLSCSELASRVEFPRGNVGSKDGGVVFLIHGTGSQGKETWGDGPYATILPDKG